MIASVLSSLLVLQAPSTMPSSPVDLARRVGAAWSGINRDTPITRADMAPAYIRFERLWARARPQGETLREFNRHFDGVTFLMMRSDFSSSLKFMNELADKLLPPGATSDAAKLARSLRVRAIPGRVRLDSPVRPRVIITPLYDVVGPTTMPAELSLVALDESPPRLLGRTTLSIDPANPRLTVPLPAPLPAAGRYELRLTFAPGADAPPTDIFVSDHSLTAISRDNALAAAKLILTSPLKDAAYAFLSRNSLLEDRVVENDSTRFRLDPLQLQRDLAAELASLQAGTNPYVNRPGDWWRTILAGATSVPARIFAPAAAVHAGTPMPLVIALHGLGGDENLFMEGYGSGVLHDLAEQRGFLLVAPLTYGVVTNAAAFDAIVETMASLYSVDRSRIYVIGHSLGAMVTGDWATRFPEKIAAATLIAGGHLTGGSSAPALVVAGEFDSLFVFDKMQAMTSDAKTRGLPAEFRPMPHYGHVLLVGDALPGAVDWMLEHRLSERRPATH